MTERQHPPCSPDLTPNDFWQFPKRDEDSGILKTSKKDVATLKIFHSTTAVPKMFLTVTASLG
jgi:hypothetical protein